MELAYKSTFVNGTPNGTGAVNGAQGMYLPESVPLARIQVSSLHAVKGHISGHPKSRVIPHHCRAETIKRVCLRLFANVCKQEPKRGKS